MGRNYGARKMLLLPPLRESERRQGSAETFIQLCWMRPEFLETQGIKANSEADSPSSTDSHAAGPRGLGAETRYAIKRGSSDQVELL